SKKDKRRENIEKAFESVGFSVDLDYPLSGVLTELSLPGEARFQSVLGERVNSGVIRMIINEEVLAMKRLS
ncbi:MAG: hypothetical protein IIB56_11370, partial [Planctomycetes bacterium]|nr:hypothetical protein [Planctomycetota bacterium]